MAFDSIHRLVGVAPDLETVPPNRPFLLGVPAADHYAESLFLTPAQAFMHSNSQRRHRRSAVMQRIAGLERALEQAQHLLHQDDLTPLLNRRGFRRACDRWAGNGPMAISACCVMIDLDGFKAINDRHGHPVGDAALVHFAATLRRHLRPADTIARLGGDEFALILMDCSGGDACLLLERLQQVLAGSPLSVPGGAVSLRFSAGVAELHAAESLEQVLERADAALLDAKQQGKAMVRLSVPPARSGQAATASAGDRQTASACVPIAIDERESDGSRILDRVPHQMPTSLATTRLDAHQAPRCWLLMAAQPIATRNPPAPPGISQANRRPVRTAGRRTAHC